ncbi:hypothetical protein H2199_002382 [Coniosporium tulheliwenetii]|uniref:Uncharacterized protein n=1 Tax=Coniosporium tulheliwenetii TaxID=3383036 RepID=A0ACC2ZGA8_9PEZI|nr:hypothetical protein H2199_002382 [Cladosporium sp. JES 115]
MEQTRALNALEPFLALSKSANSPRAAADLVAQATSAPNTYVFAELLQTPNIQALRQSPDYASYLTLLEIFAWGTWEDYQSNPSLPLSEPQQTKLRLLSLLPLASTPSRLTYDSLQTALSLPSARSLESLVTQAIYAGLVTCTLDPAHNSIAITSVAPLRDLAPGSIPALSATLEAWSARCEDALQALEAEKEAVEAAEREVERGGSGGGGGEKRAAGPGEEEGGEMDVDEVGGFGGGQGANQARRSTKRGPGVGFGRRLGVE